MFAENAYSDLKDEIEIAVYHVEQLTAGSTERAEAEQYLRGMNEALYTLEDDVRQAHKAIEKLEGEIGRANANETERALREEFNAAVEETQKAKNDAEAAQEEIKEAYDKLKRRYEETKDEAVKAKIETQVEELKTAYDEAETQRKTAQKAFNELAKQKVAYEEAKQAEADAA